MTFELSPKRWQGASEELEAEGAFDAGGTASAKASKQKRLECSGPRKGARRAGMESERLTAENGA